MFQGMVVQHARHTTKKAASVVLGGRVRSGNAGLVAAHFSTRRAGESVEPATYVYMYLYVYMYVRGHPNSLCDLARK